MKLKKDTKQKRHKKDTKKTQNTAMFNNIYRQSHVAEEMEAYLSYSHFR